MAVSRVAIQAAVAQLAAGKIFADSNGLLISDAGNKIISATRDVSVTGDQSITGAGFRPTSVEIIANIGGTVSYAVGFIDAAGNMAIGYQTTAGIFYTTASYGAYLVTPTGDAYFSFKSWDADGITVTWGKTASAAGTATLKFKFNR
jgi:hypothetical protein